MTQIVLTFYAQQIVKQILFLVSLHTWENWNTKTLSDLLKIRANKCRNLDIIPVLGSKAHTFKYYSYCFSVMRCVKKQHSATTRDILFFPFQKWEYWEKERNLIAFLRSLIQEVQLQNLGSLTPFYTSPWNISELTHPRGDWNFQEVAHTSDTNRPFFFTLIMSTKNHNRNFTLL